MPTHLLPGGAQFHHLARAAPARFPHRRVISFAFVVHGCLVGRGFKMIQMMCFSSSSLPMNGLLPVTILVGKLLLPCCQVARPCLCLPVLPHSWLEPHSPEELSLLPERIDPVSLSSV